jgi:molybdopterin-synthase adenylyltransferase
MSAAINLATPVNPARGIRQAEIIPRDQLERVAAVVVGCGAIGSWLARFLAHMGVPRFVLVDPDVVTVENLSLQGYLERHLGQAKVEALHDEIVAINNSAVVTSHAGKFAGDQLENIPIRYVTTAVFCCVDDIDVRRAVYRDVADRCTLFIDGRMAALVWRVITVDRWPDRYYPTTLFPKAEADVLRCTAKGTVFTAAAPALQMGTQLMLWLKGCRVGHGNLAREVTGNLLGTTFEAEHVSGESEEEEPPPGNPEAAGYLFT